METLFFTDLKSPGPPIFRAALPVVPHEGDMIELPDDSPAHHGWVVQQVVWNFKHEPYSVSVYLSPLP